jgi:regulator of protease activity HflC (stomatin/prohibitin superfamily)
MFGLALFLLFLVLLVGLAVASFKIVGQAEVMVIERLGRFHRIAPSGLNILVPFFERPRRDRPCATSRPTWRARSG